MIILKIKTSGHTIAIPGLPAFRSPVEVDISKLDIRVVAMYLKNSGIETYEIVAETKAHKEVYTKKDFDTEDTPEEKEDGVWKQRFSRLETMLEKITTNSSYKSISQEQTINKIKKDEPDIEKFDSFIPEVDISDMMISFSDNVKTIKQDKGIEDSADILAGLMKKK